MLQKSHHIFRTKYDFGRGHLKMLTTKKSFFETRIFAPRKLLHKDLPKSKTNGRLKRMVLPIEFQRYFSKVLANVVLGTAPTTISTFCPSLKIIKVGMLRMPY